MTLVSRVAEPAPSSHRMQATAGGSEVAGGRAGCAPVAPDAERWAARGYQDLRCGTGRNRHECG